MKKLNKMYFSALSGSYGHIVKRDDLAWWKAWIIRGISILLALVVAAIVTISLTDINPIDMYITMVNGAIGTERLTWNLFQNTAILLCVALAVTPAFKMKFWNIGAEGQILAGGFANVSCAIFLGDKLPATILIPLMLVLSVIAGCIWGLDERYHWLERYHQ